MKLIFTASIVENCLDDVSSLCRIAYNIYTMLIETKDDSILDELRRSINNIVGKLTKIGPLTDEGLLRFTKVFLTLKVYYFALADQKSLMLSSSQTQLCWKAS